MADVLTKSGAIENALEKKELHFGKMNFEELRIFYANKINMY